MRLIDADAFIASIQNFDLPDDTIDACTLRIYLHNAPTIDPVEYLNSKGVVVTNQGWLDSKPCYTCEKKHGYCVGCTKLDAWKSENQLFL